jgi:hypothetical protein
VKGLALFNIDYTAANEHRAFIRHVTTKDPSLLKKAIELIIEFIWKHVYCTNIRIEIFHLKDEATG